MEPARAVNVCFPLVADTNGECKVALMTALRTALKWLGFAALGVLAMLLLLAALMRLGYAPAGEILFSIAYCLDGYGPCGTKPHY
jgi:hypothetical protein